MPKISHIEATPLEYKLDNGKGYGNARGLSNSRSCCLVTIIAGNGVAGVGEAAGPLGVLREYVKVLTPFFIGQSLYDFGIVARKIRNKLYHFGSQGHFIGALGGINIAIYDALGKTIGAPVHDLLGGRTTGPLACYATTGYFAEDPKLSVEAQLSGLAQDEFAGVKIKIGAGIASDIERVRQARRAIGDDLLLMVDYNGNYTVDVALESMRRIEKFNIHWCEEPLPPDDIAGYAELRTRSPIRLAAGEAHSGIQEYKRLIDARGVDIIQPSLTGGGGFDEMRAVVLLAAMNNLRIALPFWGGAVSLNAVIHFAASLPPWPHTDNAPYPVLIEYDVANNPLREELVHNPVKPNKGLLPVPEGSGLGVNLNPLIVERYSIK